MDHPINIGPRERAKRRTIGVVMLAVAVAGGVWMQVAALAPWTRLFLFVPFFIGWLGILQAAGST